MVPEGWIILLECEQFSEIYSYLEAAVDSGNKTDTLSTLSVPTCTLSAIYVTICMHSCRWGSFEIGGKSILSIMSLGWHSLLTFIGSLKSQDDLLWCLDNLEVFFRGHERKARAMNHAFLFSLNSVWFKVFLIHFLIQEAQLLMLIIKICFSFHAKQKKKKSLICSHQECSQLELHVKNQNKVPQA